MVLLSCKSQPRTRMSHKRKGNDHWKKKRNILKPIKNCSTYNYDEYEAQRTCRATGKSIYRAVSALQFDCGGYRPWCTRRWACTGRELNQQIMHQWFALSRFDPCVYWQGGEGERKAEREREKCLGSRRLLMPIRPPSILHSASFNIRPFNSEIRKVFIGHCSRISSTRVKRCCVRER